MFRIWDPGIEETLGTLFAGEYDLLLGRRTYDIFAAYWPYAEGDNKPMSEAFGRANKYVLTRGQQDLPWINSHRLSGIEDIARLKQEPGSDIIIQGSSTLYAPLLAGGMIDRLITMTFPVLLEHGKRLFGDGTPVAALKMTDHRVTERGTVIAEYKPGGKLPPYPDQAPVPASSERETARQARIAEGDW